MSLQGKNVLVTGADGFIGSHVTELLLQAGARVTALSQYNSFGTNGWLDEPEFASQSQLTVVRGDIRDKSNMSRIAAGHSHIFHLAALISIPHSYAAAQSYVDTNIVGTLNILEAAREHSIERVVHTSTSEVFGTAQFTPITEDHPLQGQSPYSASKIGADMMAEAYARSFDVPVVVLRPFNTYGPRQSERAIIPTVIRQALDPACEAIRLGDLSPLRDFTYVGDTAKAFMAAAKADLPYGVPFNCGTGIAVTIGDIAERIIALTGCNKPLESDAGRRRPEKSEVYELRADASRFTSASGWKAEGSLEEGLGRTIEWWRHAFDRGAVRRDAGYLT